MNRIYHMTSEAEWDAQSDADAYVAPSLESDGFIHASHANQIVETANRIFAGRTDLRILVVDVDKLTAPLKVEDSYGHGSFPHVYGPIDKAAVIEVVPFASKPDGSFELPDSIPDQV